MIGRLLFILCLTWAFSMPASATIVSGEVTGGDSFIQGGFFEKLTVPFPGNEVGQDNFQDFNLYGFDEGQNIAITQDLNVDILAVGMGPGIVSAGTIVASQYIFFDPINFVRQIGTVTFDSDIIAIITSSENLLASDFLINNMVTYLSPPLRGLESGDSVFISGARTITVDWFASTPGDYVRVLTEFSPAASVVPLPAAAWLFGTFLFGLFGVSRFKKSD